MNPGVDDVDYPLGEISGGKLILAIEASPLEVERARYLAVLAQIAALLKLQTEQVVAFYENLRQWLEGHVSGPARTGSGLLH